ncbi:HNH endonuclease [Methylotenera mobilis]|uniref:HNH endonuclease n=1 Tax=Methylotenera mobilis (strain JLW8 / ATCC BAA-1282 / DSM 17540) TaxID=583345 RepID=C6WZ12_METML|nr:HNH endonuclease [Methylotenera mobilis]ACT48960.1 HNH endonuclease [Methylotenera mobilis JLW8]
MPTTLIKSRLKAFNLQQGRCIYCELPMWSDDPESFAKKYKITTKQAKPFQCTAEHLEAKQDGGKDHESNIVAACHYCNQKRHQCKSPKDPVSYKHYVTNRLEKGKWNLCMMYRHSKRSRKIAISQSVLTSTGMHPFTSTPDRVRFG